MNSRYDFRVLRPLRQRFKLTMEQLAEISGLTYPTIASTETNKAMPSLKTLDALAGVFQMSTSKLLSLTERVSVQKRTAKIASVQTSDKSQSGLENCRVAAFDKAKILRVSAKAGEEVHVMELHEDCHEICYVLSGCVQLRIEDQRHTLAENETILFDGVLDHAYNQIETGEYITVHIPKDIAIIETLLGSAANNQNPNATKLGQ